MRIIGPDQERFAAGRMRRLYDIAGEYGQPWWKKWAASVIELIEVGPEWYRQY